MATAAPARSRASATARRSARPARDKRALPAEKLFHAPIIPHSRSARGRTGCARAWGGRGAPARGRTGCARQRRGVRRKPPPADRRCAGRPATQKKKPAAVTRSGLGTPKKRRRILIATLQGRPIVRIVRSLLVTAASVVDSRSGARLLNATRFVEVLVHHLWRFSIAIRRDFTFSNSDVLTTYSGLALSQFLDVLLRALTRSSSADGWRRLAHGSRFLSFSRVWIFSKKSTTPSGRSRSCTCTRRPSMSAPNPFRRDSGSHRDQNLGRLPHAVAGPAP